MNGYNLYLKYSFKRIRQSFDSFLGFDVWYNLYLKYSFKRIKFMLCMNANLSMYCKARFSDLIL
jgi:hypothetical protein